MTHKIERYALLHVADKTGIVELAWALKELGFKFLADGAAASALRQAEIEVTELSPADPTILSAISAGQRSPGIQEHQKRRSLPIELVAVNFYPLAEIDSAKLPHKEALSTINIEASALLRAAARNFRKVICLCDPQDYGPVIESLRRHADASPARRQALAAKAFHYSAYYDSTVAQYLGGRWDKLPHELVFGLKKSSELASGENRHQQGALYALSGARPWGVNEAHLLYGPSISFNHYIDLDAAWDLAGGFTQPACAIVKHGVPAAVAVSENLAEATRLAYRGDPRGCLRGTAAVNREVDEEAASFFAEEVIGCIAAPGFSAKALTLLKAKKDIRLVTLPSTLITAHELDLRSVAGGVLVQEKDHQALPENLKASTRRAPNEVEMNSLRLAWRVAKHARTYAAVICRGGQTLAVASGQTSRLDAVRLALIKSRERHPIVAEAPPLVLASDGPLGVEHISEALQGGIKAVIHTGGAGEDEEAAALCDQRKASLILTGVRHFKH